MNKITQTEIKETNTNVCDVTTCGVLEPLKKNEGKEKSVVDVGEGGEGNKIVSLECNKLPSVNNKGSLTLNTKPMPHKMFKTNISKLNNRTETLDILSLLVPSKFENIVPSKSVRSENAEKHNQELAIVKFHIKNDVVVASAFKLSATVRHVKECFADISELDENLFALDIEGSEVNELLTLAHFGLNSLENITFNVRSKIGKTGTDIIINKVDENIPTLTVITVHCNVDGILKDVIVEIEDQSCEKEWLGGFRNIFTKIVYHHARVQTLPKLQETVKYIETGKEYLQFHRDTQTPFRPKHIVIDTLNDKATQMSRSDLYIDSKTDRIIVPKPYMDFEQSKQNDITEKSATIIQKAVKTWIRKRNLKTIIRMQMEVWEDMKRQKAQIQKEEAVQERDVITGAAYPVKRDDFYMLYLMVGNWWKNEWKRINETRSEETKQAEVETLLQKHVELLREIERHKTVGKKEALQKERMRFIQQLAQPVTFKNSKGQMVSIDDLNTQRAREFKEIYSALIRTKVPPKDRISLLLVLKNLINNHYMDYEYASDLISLIDREINLLSSGFKMADLKGLHLRIEQLFMNFLENQECNPKAAAYKKPNMPKSFHTQFQCFRCKKLLPVSKFPVHVRMNKYNEGGCKSCTWIHNIGHQRVDMSPFVKLKKQVQNSEMEKCCHSAVCFIFQPIGMAYLTMKIWHGHSAISECSDVSKLQHVRWLKDVEWTPWNTVLLTNQEAKCHTSIPDIFDFYEQSFINSVQQKHILARSTFEPLLKINHDIQSSGEWANIRDEGVFLHPSHAEEFAQRNDYDKI